jgi:hypothetical protein
MKIELTHENAAALAKYANGLAYPV